jgi:parvulin-like peptidyl-prolyl isomerase
MTNKQLLILVIVTVVMVGVTIALHVGSGPGKVEFEPGSRLVQGLAPETIKKVVIKTEDRTITLLAKDKGPVVVEKNNYPADGKKIDELFMACSDIECNELVTANPENHDELKVAKAAKDNTDTVEIEFYDEAGKLIVGVIKGKSAESSGGAYVRLAGKDDVYTTRKALWLKTAALDYMNKSLVKTDKDKIQKVEVETAKGAYAIERDKDKKIALLSIPKGKRAKDFDVGSTFGAMTGLDMSGVFPKDNEKVKDLKWDVTFKCHVETHLVYVAKLAKKDGTHYVSLSAYFPQGISIERPRKDEKDEELKKKAAIWEAAEQTLPKFNNRHKDWVYELSSYEAEKLRKPMADLIEDIPDPAKPTEVSARHILIGYKGSERSKATRTKDAAKKLAGEMLAKVEAKPADFAKLAKQHSDGPSKTKGGDLGSFKKGMMSPNFDKAVFALKVDEVSEVVETPFGFHVIQRTK